jgi:pentatricopeptide repeat protein
VLCKRQVTRLADPAALLSPPARRPCQMLSEGLTPNLVTYNTLLEVYAKQAKWEQALSTLDALQRQVGRGRARGLQERAGPRRRARCRGGLL